MKKNTVIELSEKDIKLLICEYFSLDKDKKIDLHFQEIEGQGDASYLKLTITAE